MNKYKFCLFLPLSLSLSFFLPPSLSLFLQVHNEFILPSEQEGFIHRMCDIIKRAESLMEKDALDLQGDHGMMLPPYLTETGLLSASQVSPLT